MKNKIILVPFPFDDFSATKLRPALCLTDAVGQYQHVVIAFITSKIPADGEPTDILVFKNEVGFKETGLKVDSAIRLHKMVTIPAYLIQRKLGNLPRDFHDEITAKLKILFSM